MDQKHGALRIAIFRLNFMVPKGDEGDPPRSDANAKLASILQNAQQGEHSGLRVLTDPDRRAGGLLRLRQDQQRGVLPLSESGTKPETALPSNVPGPSAAEFPK